MKPDDDALNIVVGQDPNTPRSESYLLQNLNVDITATGSTKLYRWCNFFSLVLPS